MIPTPFFYSNLSQSKISKAGIRNANVLPEPVLAAATISLPLISGSITFSYIFVRYSKPKI